LSCLCKFPREFTNSVAKRERFGALAAHYRARFAQRGYQHHRLRPHAWRRLAIQSDRSNHTFERRRSHSRTAGTHGAQGGFAESFAAEFERSLVFESSCNHSMTS